MAAYAGFRQGFYAVDGHGCYHGRPGSKKHEADVVSGSRRQESFPLQIQCQIYFRPDERLEDLV